MTAIETDAPKKERWTFSWKHLHDEVVTTGLCTGCAGCVVVCPHDVLGYPSSFERGGYTAEQFAGLGVPLPPTVDEDLRAKPTVHSLMKIGQTAYIGALRDDQARRDYVNFYAYLHRVVDEKIGRLLAALGDPADPASLRSRTSWPRIAARRMIR